MAPAASTTVCVGVALDTLVFLSRMSFFGQNANGDVQGDCLEETGWQVGGLLTTKPFYLLLADTHSTCCLPG